MARSREDEYSGGIREWLNQGAGRFIVIVLAIGLVGLAGWRIYLGLVDNTTPDQRRALDAGWTAPYVCKACTAAGEMSVPFGVKWDRYECAACGDKGDLAPSKDAWGATIECPKCGKPEAVKKALKCPECGEAGAVKGIKCRRCRQIIVETYQSALRCPKCGFVDHRSGPLRDPNPAPIPK